jgi:hypothetical protein
MNEHMEEARGLVAGIRPPAGRADLTVNQRLELAGIHAALAIADEQRTANYLSALKLGLSPLDVSSPEKIASIKTPSSRGRERRANALRSAIKSSLGLNDIEEAL